MLSDISIATPTLTGLRIHIFFNSSTFHGFEYIKSMFLKGSMRYEVGSEHSFSIQQVEPGRPSEGHNAGGVGGKAHGTALLGKRCRYHEAANGSVG